MRLKHLLIPTLLFFFTLFIYTHNLSRSVYGGDVGDLITAAFVGGVAHPPGYPLFTLLGFLLTRFSFWPSPAFAVGFISAFSGALGILFFFFTAKLLTKNTVISLICSLIVGFSYYFWFYSEVADVFMLNSFFCMLLIYLAVTIYKTKSLKNLPFFSFFLGLSLTNHQTILFAYPSLFLLIFPTLVRYIKKKKLRTLFVFLNIVAALVGFSVYIYVFIASSHNPVLNWDNVHDLSSFLHLFLRQDYGTFSAGVFTQSTFLQRFIIVKTYVWQLIIQLTLPVALLACLGFVQLMKTQRLLGISFLIGFLFTGPLFIAYAGFPLTGNFYFGVNERFFLLSIIFLALYIPFGLEMVSSLFEKLLGRNALLIQSIFFIIPLMLFIYNFPKTDLSHIFVGDTYAIDLLKPLPQKSVLFVAGDTIIFNTWYEHYVMGIQPNTQVLNITGNVGSPYYAVLENRYMKSHSHANNAQLMQGIVQELPQNGMVFSVEALQTPKDTTWMPYGLALQLLSTAKLPSEEKFTLMQHTIWSQLHIPYIPTGPGGLALSSVTISDIPSSYANAMLLVADFYVSEYKDTRLAKKWLDKALQVDPEYEKTYSSLGAYYLTVTKSCLLAKSSFAKAIDINPVDNLNYFLLYITDKDCLKDTGAANIIKKSFEKQFQIPFGTALSRFSKKK